MRAGLNPRKKCCIRKSQNIYFMSKEKPFVKRWDGEQGTCRSIQNLPFLQQHQGFAFPNSVIQLELSRRATSKDRLIPSALALNMSCSPLTSELVMKCSRSSNPSLLNSAALDEGCDLVGRESVLHLRSSSVASLIMPLEMSSHPLFSQFLKARTCEEGCSPNFGLVYSPANSYYTAFWLCLYSVALLLSALRIIKTLNLI